jgi:hypothetical protein
LHPEFVDTQNLTASICTKCRASITKHTKPKYSVANGYDFGRLDLLGLPELNDVEKAVISPFRRYDKMFKLVSSVGLSSSTRQTALTGHIFHVQHDGIQEVVRALPNLRAVDSIQITFVGTSSEWRSVSSRLVRNKEFTVSAINIYKWLKALKELHHPLYEEIEIIENAEFTQSLINAPHRIIQNAQVFEDEEGLRLDRIFSASDVAAVRPNGNLEINDEQNILAGVSTSLLFHRTSDQSNRFASTEQYESTFLNAVRENIHPGNENNNNIQIQYEHT